LFLSARRYASAGNSDRNVSVRPSVRLSESRYCVKTKNGTELQDRPNIGSQYVKYYQLLTW